MSPISSSILTLLVVLGIYILPTFAASKTKPHTHNGLLEPYDGKHIPYSLTKEQNDLLNSGKPVTINQRNGKSGRGIVIQDIHAPPSVCLSRISDLANYSKMVPNVKSIEIYENEVSADGAVNTGAMFKVGVSFVTFGYYLRLKYDPSYSTYTWTLDYRYSSDFDDNTGHWQAMEHPTKSGWSRVLYSTEVKLFPWIPEFVITFLTKTALIESTTWVKRESEKAARLLTEAPASEDVDLSSCFLEAADGSASYVTKCIDDYVNNRTIESSADEENEPETDAESEFDEQEEQQEYQEQEQGQEQQQEQEQEQQQEQEQEQGQDFAESEDGGDENDREL